MNETSINRGIQSSPLGDGGILEIVTLDIKESSNTEFEEKLKEAQSVISKSKGYLGHQFHKCIEQDNRYIFLIRWQTLEDHTIGFRESDLFQQWRGLIGPFFKNPPFVQHYELKFEM